MQYMSGFLYYHLHVRYLEKLKVVCAGGDEEN